MLRRAFAAPLLIVSVAAAGAVALWLGLRHDQEAKVANIAEAVSYATRSELARDLGDKLRAIRDLAQYWATYAHLPSSEWPTELREEVVKDNGPGFDDKLADEVFKPMTRLPDASASDGLGLELGIRVAESENCVEFLESSSAARAECMERHNGAVIGASVLPSARGRERCRHAALCHGLRRLGTKLATRQADIGKFKQEHRNESITPFFGCNRIFDRGACASASLV
jgi:hypothetical protein